MMNRLIQEHIDSGPCDICLSTRFCRQGR
jgi:hypothetical protein